MTATSTIRPGPSPATTRPDSTSLWSTVMTMLRIGWRAHRVSLIAWTLVNVGILLAIALSVADLYDTPEKIQTYADAVAGGALNAINGKVEGIDTLGGVIQDEFTFVSSFLAPLIGISLVTRLTRSEEEAGRLELLGARSIHRRSVPLAAMLLTTAMLLVGVAGMMLAVMTAGVPADQSLTYALSIGLLSFFFAGVAATAAQLMLHARGVYTIGFAVVLLSYLLRGVGDVSDNWLVWLSPLGWQEKVAAFGPTRTWALLLPLAGGLALTGLAAFLADRRDLGSSLRTPGPGPATGTPFLRSPFGTAVWVQRPAIIGWSVGAVLFAGMFGALSNETVQAIQDNPALAEALGADGRPEDGFLALTLLYTAVIGCAYVVGAIAAMVREERAGHLEAVLARPIDRTRWLITNVAVAIVGVVVLVTSSTVVFSLTTAAVLDDADMIVRLLGSGMAYLPAQLLTAGLAIAVFGFRPRLFGIAWALVGLIAAIAFLGPGLDLDQPVLNLAPTTHVGSPPDGDVEAMPLAMMSIGALVLIGVGVAAFRRRGIPQR